jgi:5-formyltetrahydrofolate cyclo-ligase
VGIDVTQRRVGFGKGMYDRFFHSTQKKVFMIFVQRESCSTKEFVCDTYDIKCDLYITPTKTVKKLYKTGIKYVE